MLVSNGFFLDLAKFCWFPVDWFGIEECYPAFHLLHGCLFQLQQCVLFIWSSLVFFVIFPFLHFLGIRPKVLEKASLFSKNWPPIPPPAAASRVVTELCATTKSALGFSRFRRSEMTKKWRILLSIKIIVKNHVRSFRSRNY